MRVPSEILLDALRFADYDTRLAMLLVSRRLYRIVDESRTTLGLPEVWIPPASVALLRVLMVLGGASLIFFTLGLNAYFSWLVIEKYQMPPTVEAYLAMFSIFIFGTIPNFVLPFFISFWLDDQAVLCRRLHGCVDLDERTSLSQALLRFHISTFSTLAALFVLNPLLIIVLFLQNDFPIVTTAFTMALLSPFLHFILCGYFAYLLGKYGSADDCEP